MPIANSFSFSKARRLRSVALVILSLTALPLVPSLPSTPAAAKDLPAITPGSLSFPSPAGSLAPFIAGDDKWAPGSGVRGVNGTVYDFAVDGSGNTYVGGYLNLAGNLPVRNIAKWDGSNWSALSYGLDGWIRALAWDSLHGWLYAGGEFTNICANADCSLKNPSRGIARWDPSGGGSWHALHNGLGGGGLGGGVYALALDTAGNLYAGGSFSTICFGEDCSGGATAYGVAEWIPAGNGSWSALLSPGGNGVSGGTVIALAWWNAPLIGEVLVVGGTFISAGGNPVNHLAYWAPGSPGTWSSFLSGVNGTVNALAVDWSTSSVVVGGSFQYVCQLGAIPPACGTPTRVNNLALFAPAVPYWGPLNYGVDGVVDAVSIDNIHQRVYVGGGFQGYCTQINCTNATSPTYHVARFDYAVLPGSWATLGAGTDNRVLAVAWNQAAGLLYAGGSFGIAGSVPTSSVAKWDGSAWSSVGIGAGVGEDVYALAADANGRVYVGGSFRSVGNLLVNRVAVWNSKTGAWSALNYGVDGPVYAMKLDASGNLYVAGNFSFLCANAQCSGPVGQQVNGIAKWTPSPGGDAGSWSPVGAGLHSWVYALALDHNNKLYAGGSIYGICKSSDCHTPDPAHFVVVWDGNQWSNLGFGLDYAVRALAVDKDNNLYAGGQFTYLCDQSCVGGQTANYIGKWTPASGGGGSWSTLANGLDGPVWGLVVDRNNVLFAGGIFRSICSGPACTSNTQPASAIAKWDGSWSSVGNGLKGTVFTVALDEWNQLFAGGDFQSLCADPNCYGAGSTVNGIARWDGTSWSPLGSGMGPMPGAFVRALSYAHGTMNVGGYFGTAGDKVSANFARYIYGNYTDLPLLRR